MGAGGSHYTYIKYNATFVSTHQVCDAPLSNSGLLQSTRIQRCHTYDSNITTLKTWSKRTSVQVMLEFYLMPSLTHEPSGQYPAQKAPARVPAEALRVTSRQLPNYVKIYITYVYSTQVES